MKAELSPREMQVGVIRWLLAPLFDWCVIIAASILALQTGEWWACVLAAFLIGARQHALGLAGHEGTHGAITSHRRLGDLLAGVLCWWPLMIAGDTFRTFHLAHHGNFNAADDPELAHKRAFSNNWSLPMGQRKMVLLLLADLACLNWREVAAIFRAISIPRSRFDWVGMLAWWGIAAALLPWQFVALWLVCRVTTAMAAFRARVWVEHFGTDTTHRVYAGPCARFFYLPHSCWHHPEHHERPRTPYWQLQDLRRADAVLTACAVIDSHATA